MPTLPGAGLSCIKGLQWTRAATRRVCADARQRGFPSGRHGHRRGDGCQVLGLDTVDDATPYQTRWAQVVQKGPEVAAQATEAAMVSECEAQTVQGRPQRISWARLLILSNRKALLIHWAISDANQPAMGSRLTLSIMDIEHIKGPAQVEGLFLGGNNSNLRPAPALWCSIGACVGNMDFRIAVQALRRNHVRAKPDCFAVAGLSTRQPTQVQAEGAQTMIGFRPLSES